MKLRRIVAQNIKGLRREKGMSQEELAGRADMNRNYVGMIERSEHAATVDMLERIADALGVEPGEFFRRD